MGLIELAQKRGESELVYRVFTRLSLLVIPSLPTNLSGEETMTSVLTSFS